MSTEAYVRRKLDEASKAPGRGHIAKIARAADCDARTVRAILANAHNTHVATMDKLAAYFRKMDKKAAKEEEVKA